MPITFKKSFILLAAFMTAPGVGSAGQAVPFDELYGKTSPSKMLLAQPGVPVSRAARVSGDKGLDKAAPELAYENLVDAPVWTAPASPAADGTDLKAGFSPARHQGGRNVCNAFASLALAEYLVWEKESVKPDFSEEFLYYNTKLNFTNGPALQGYKAEPGLPGYATVLALSGGVVAETEWPFLAALPPHKPAPPLTDPDVGTPPAGIAQKVLGYGFAAQAVRRSEIKYFLAKERRPVVMNLMLYTGNIDNATGRLQQPTAAQRQACFSAGSGCGGHVVLLTGYDPQAKEYLFRNSWGANWGNAGYGRVPEAYVEQDCEACHFLGTISGQNLGGRILMINAAYGWSAVIK